MKTEINSAYPDRLKQNYFVRFFKGFSEYFNAQDKYQTILLHNACTFGDSYKGEVMAPDGLVKTLRRALVGDFDPKIIHVKRTIEVK